MEYERAIADLCTKVDLKLLEETTTMIDFQNML